MDFSDVQNQILNLPDTFKRFGPIFAALISSFSASLARNTRAMDQIASMINVNTARFGWLDAIGLLFGLPRNQYESDVQYRIRLVGTLSSTTCTPQSIINFLHLALNLNTNITEDFILSSYQINFTSPPNQQTLQTVAITLNRVRPAGVPFLPLYVLKGGLYLDTINYFGVKKVTGSYLSNPTISINVTIAPNTNNQFSQLPVPYLTDPFLTGVAQVSYPL